MTSFSYAALLMLFCLTAMTVAGCTTFAPTPLDEIPFRERAVTKMEDNVRVSAVVLSEEESESVFDIDLYSRGIQPVWLEIANKSTYGMRFLQTGLDPEYFAPLEVSYIKRFRWAKYANEQIDQHFLSLAMNEHIPAGATRSGFVFTHLEHGTKLFNVDVMGKDHVLRSFTFFVQVPGLESDYRKVDWAGLYPRSEIVDHDRDSLRRVLRELPCCVSSAGGGDQGQPLNVVLVGGVQDIIYVLVRSGWDETGETTRPSGKSKPIRGIEERYRPVSVRYVFGRAQDMSFRKSRHGVHPRTHLRLWMSPVTLDGVPVWVGQVGRDFAVTSPSSTRITDADDVRFNLTQDLMYAQGLAGLGFVRRRVENLEPDLHESLTGAPYYADGYRAVLLVSSEPVALDEMEHLGWAVPKWD